MLKNKKSIILSVLVLIIIIVVFSVVYSGIFNREINISDKPIKTMDNVGNDDIIVEMNLINPSDSKMLDSVIKQVDRLKADGVKWAAATDGAVCYGIKYKSDEYTVGGFLAAPGDYLDRKYPVMIYNRGGANITDFAFGQIYEDTPYFLARAGFIVLATQYRGWGKGSGQDEFGGGDVRDVTALIDLAEKFSFSNGKIYMFGWSRGAMETYIVLSRDDRITAAVAGAGPTDFFKFYDEQDNTTKAVCVRTAGGTPDQQPSEYEKRSAVYWADKINTPLLIAHGTDDTVVQPHHSVDLYDKMKVLGKDVELKLYEGEDHSVAYENNLGEYFAWLLSH